MTSRTLFATHVHDEPLGDAPLVDALAHASRDLAVQDRAGRDWCAAQGYRGYTSYASLDDLPRRDPHFGDLVRLLDRHVATFAKRCGMTLRRKLKLDSIWVNVMAPGGHHSGHLHPGSIVSGTVYIAVPDAAGAIRFEDPRLPMMMHAPYSEEWYVQVMPTAGNVMLWESWLRHEVLPNRSRSDRISISFNYDK